MNIPERITALREVSVSADYILGLPKNLKYPERKKAPERRCTRKDTTPVLFTKGELYCYAVIFGLKSK